MTVKVRHLIGRSHLKAFLSLLGLVVLTAFFSTYPIRIMKQIVDAAASMGNGQVRAILIYGGVYLAFQITRAGLHGLMLHKTIVLQQKISMDIQVKVYDALLHASIRALDERSTSNYTNTLIEDTKHVIQNTIDPLIKMMFSMVSFTMGIYFMMTINRVLPFIILPLGGITAMIARKIQKKSLSNASLLRDRSETLWKVYAEGIKGILPIRLFRYEKSYHDKVSNCVSDMSQVEIKQSKINAVSYFALSSLFMISIGGILITAGIFLSKGYITVGALMAILMYNHMLIDPLIDLLSLQQSWIKSKVSLSRLMTVMEMESEAKSRVNASHLDRIVLEKVTFSYGEKTILNQMDLLIEKGEKIAIIGKTGAGKSSLAKVISGIYDIHSGKIKYYNGDERLEGYPQLGYLVQDGYLFDMSIRDNIKMANANLTEEAYRALLKICVLEAVCDEHREKAIGENGCHLSGGERKRVQLARTLAYEGANLYIFDELTSALDKVTARTILENVLKYTEGKIALFIEHNVEFLDVFDRVVSIPK